MTSVHKGAANDAEQARRAEHHRFAEQVRRSKAQVLSSPVRALPFEELQACFRLPAALNGGSHDAILSNVDEVADRVRNWAKRVQADGDGEPVEIKVVLMGSARMADSAGPVDPGEGWEHQELVR